MNQLNIINRNGQLLADSREISLMIGKQHAHLLRDIDGYAAVLIQSKFGLNDFFIETTYKDSIGRTLKRYDITKLGCDMVANKMSGSKGVLFTAAYVSQFNNMERKLTLPALPQNYKEALVALVEQVDMNEKLHTQNLLLEQKVSEYEPKVTYVDQILKSKGTMTITQIAKDYDLTGPALNKILHEEKVQYKQNRQWLLYANHMNKGYTKSETIDITRSNGDPDVTLNTRWTQEGRLFIHNVLGKRGIIPFMDRENPGA